MAVNVRFVLTGACHPYSGRQVLFAFPLASDNNPTTVLDIKSIIRRCWPSGELPQVTGRIATIGLKVLKNGKLLDDSDVLSNVLTAQEQHDSSTHAHTWGTGFDDSTQTVSNTVLMHLVFQNAPPPRPVATTSKETPEPKHRVSVDSDSSCACCVM
jgi:hypothetical protein